MLALDLGVFHRTPHRITVREASIWVGVWITLSLIFNAGIYFVYGRERALEYLTGYVIEYSLSVDNIFVFAVIFSYFSVPSRFQHKVLFWGILGALVMRGIMILLGTALIARFHWIIYIFGAFLIYTGIRMALRRDAQMEPGRNPAVRLTRRLFPILKRYHGDRFFVTRAGRRYATPLLLVLVVVEATDVVFALDSIPAIFAITRDPFIVYTSNVFAILGLRSLYFALRGALDRFHLLEYGLALVLIFVGVKMLLESWVEIPTTLALGVVVTILAVAVMLSLLRPPRAGAPLRFGSDEPPDQSTPENNRSQRMS